MTAPRCFAVLGDPIAHSRSPAMHNAAFAELGLPHRYFALRVPSDQLAIALRGIAALEFGGLNITVPHKAAAVALCDELSPDARRIGAVNTIGIRNGRLHGDNTDRGGFLDALAELPGGLPRRAVVLGGGGASRAVVDALVHLERPALLHWVSRSPASLPMVGAQPTAYDELGAAMKGADLIINCTSVGMEGGPEGFPVPLQLAGMAEAARAIDLVYPRRAGSWLDEADALGHATQDGLPMLLWQGVRSLGQWLGRPIDPPAIHAMRNALM